MEIGRFLQRIAEGYTMANLHSEGHRLLRLAPDVFKPLIPVGFNVEGSGGKGTPTFTPWIGILDPDEAPNPGNGIYLFYLFKKDLKEVVLTLNQGITQLSRSLGFKEARPVLKGSAERIRQTLLSADLAGLETSVDFGSHRRQAGYAAGNILAKTYRLAELPTEQQLVDDLRRMILLYQNSVAAKRALLVSEPGIVLTGSPTARQEPGEAAGGFKPKDRHDYLVQIAAGPQRRRADRHENLVTEYAKLAQNRGHKPSNQQVHPRDLTITVSGEHWLVEAKVVYKGNAAQAVRAAIGQLMEYSHILYEPAAKPRLMALFTEPIGNLYVELLEGLGIAAVWKGDDGWEGSPQAMAAKLI